LLHWLDFDGRATGQQKVSIYRDNVVIVTTLVDLSGQLSNLRLEVHRLADSMRDCTP